VQKLKSRTEFDPLRSFPSGGIGDVQLLEASRATAVLFALRVVQLPKSFFTRVAIEFSPTAVCVRQVFKFPRQKLVNLSRITVCD